MDHLVDDYEALRDFLLEAELHQYYELFRDILKVSKLSQLKYVAIEDLAQIGLSKPEQRRYKKLYTKYFPNNYMTKIKKLLSANKKQETFNHGLDLNTVDFHQYSESNTKISPKHIISIEDITINKELGMGQFGVVQQGTWATGNQRLQVAIKCLGNERMTSNSTEFLKEAAVMHSIEHPSIVRLYGVVLHMDSLMLVTELAPLRSLLECLQEVTFRSNFPVPNLCEFAEQICDGMTYLENKRLIHRDLAARNILVFSKDRVKISDFGLSRALGVGKDYYQTNYNVNLKLPVAWCAPECILYLRFTSASDVWAFGVCLWEMFTYGFRPWVAFSGQQILEAIDAPNYQRLERPECCPDAYYSLMLECWSHDPNNRPKFKDLKPRLKQIRPEEVQAIGNQQRSVEGLHSNFLKYKVGQKITVLGKEDFTKTAMWYGVLSGGTCGTFHPNNTKPIIKNERSQSLEPGSSPHPSRTIRSSLLRSDAKRHTVMGKRSIQRSMISSPQGDVKHTGHVGADGAYFGDISFLDPAGCPPRQIVTPYRPSEDLEQVPLINPNSPSHLTAASTPYPLLTSGFEQRPGCDQVDLACVDSKQKPIKKGHLKSVLEPTTSKSLLSKVKSATLGRSHKTEDGIQGRSAETHEYHEISDTDTESTATDNAKADVPSPDAVIMKASTDFSKSLLDEMESMFRNLDDRRRNEINLHHEIDAAIRAHTLNKTEKKKSFHTATMKLMSAHDTRTLDTAVALANEITSKSMTGLDETKLPTSPSERLKFHFKFPLVSLHHNNHHEGEKEICGKRNFSEEANSVPNIQETITEESKMVYASLVEGPTSAISTIQLPQENPSTSTIPKETRNQSPRVVFNSLPSTSSKVFINPRVVDTCCNDGNEIPLPPRTTKPKLVDKPRHVRKHPLRFPICCEPQPSPLTTRPRQAPVNTYQNIGTVIQNEYSEGPVRNNPSIMDPATNPFYPSCEDIVLPDLSKNPFMCYLSNYDAVTDEGEDAIFEEVFLKGGSSSSERTNHKDHVSVEDLLQFADRKPSSKQRGVESDEVRIMNKVLKEISPEECLEALEFTDWNIHIAIKLLKMKIAVAGSGETKFEELQQELESADGDVPKAAAAFINLNKKEDV
ncbi:activated Cdc42 kinase-like isoform X2 [Pieris napi]|uniref:activated Cdc42 kinase-like isoform X2 n=1 Tax=Pieris napi TaxID=78633 RepID=UPI001FBA3612|nr:activated Cdc42 kinase-like isoform X2 [Pieris napi]